MDRWQESFGAHSGYAGTRVPEAAPCPPSRVEGVSDRIARQWTASPMGRLRGGPGQVSAVLWKVESLADVAVVNDRLHDVHIISPFIAGRATCDFRLADGSRCRSRFAPEIFAVTGAGEVAEVRVVEATATFLDIYIPHDSLSRIVDEELERSVGISINPRRSLVARDACLSRIGGLVATEIQRADALTQLQADAFTVQLCVHLARSWFNDGKQIDLRARGGLSAWQIKRVVERLRDKIDDDVTLTELADLVGLSRFHFARSFKESVGVPPHRYHRLLRVERACELLTDSRMSILEIALSVGYESPQAMTRIFRKELGVTPSAYRRGATAPAARSHAG